MLRQTLGAAGEFEIHGELRQLHGQALIRYRPGSVRIEHLLDAWLDLLLVTVVEPARVLELHYFGAGKEFVHYRLAAPQPELAAALVERYLGFYLQCWQQPQDLLPDVLAAMLAQDGDPLKQEEALLKTLDNAYCSIHDPAIHCMRT